MAVQCLPNLNFDFLFFKVPLSPYRLLKWLSGKESTCQCRRCRRCSFNPRGRKVPWRRKWLPTPVFLPGEFRGPSSLVGCSPWGRRRVRQQNDWTRAAIQQIIINSKVLCTQHQGPQTGGWWPPQRFVLLIELRHKQERKKQKTKFYQQYNHIFIKSKRFVLYPAAHTHTKYRKRIS